MTWGAAGLALGLILVVEGMVLALQIWVAILGTFLMMLTLLIWCVNSMVIIGMENGPKCILKIRYTL